MVGGQTGHIWTLRLTARPTLYFAPTLRLKRTAPSQKTDNWWSWTEACGYIACPTNADTVSKPAEKKKTKKNVKAGEKIRSQVQYPTIREKTNQEAAQIPAKTDDK